MAVTQATNNEKGIGGKYGLCPENSKFSGYK